MHENTIDSDIYHIDTSVIETFLHFYIFLSTPWQSIEYYGSRNPTCHS